MLILHQPRIHAEELSDNNALYSPGHALVGVHLENKRGIMKNNS